MSKKSDRYSVPENARLFSNNRFEIVRHKVIERLDLLSGEIVTVEITVHHQPLVRIRKRHDFRTVVSWSFLFIRFIVIEQIAYKQEVFLLQP